MGYGGHGGWSTVSELNFVKGLGSWNSPFMNPKGTREELVKKYIKTMDMREDWGDINNQEVWKFAKALLDNDRLSKK